MSMLTRCPACQTCYRVVPDQLRVSQGWVRCGQCKEIFDAAAHELLVPAGSAEPERTNPVAPVLADSGAVALAQPQALSADELDVPDTVAASSSGSDDARPPTWQADLHLSLHGEASGLADSAPTVPAPVSNSENAPVKHADPALDVGAQIDVGLEGGVSGADGTLRTDPDWALRIVPQELSFLQTQSAQTLPAKRGFSWLWFVMALGLCAVFLGQWAYRERNQLALQFPKAQPLLLMACQVLHCQLEPVRKLDALVIEDSGLTAAGPGRYRLSLVIKNKSHQAVATPHVEVSLTDSLDQVLVRRVLSPQEMGISEISMSAGQSWPVQTGLELMGQPPVSGVSGYRLLAFYP